jgi:hypothetical protein
MPDQVKDTKTMNDQIEKLSNGLPPPPIPQRLREMLKDYPEHLERLQEELNSVVDGPDRAKGPLHYTFEVATWALEGQLGTFVHEAQDELEAAQASGDAGAVARAREKEFLMGCARSGSNGMYKLDEIWDYLEEHKEALK